jgi:1-acyl-sn-glycerol-3-phosphate acyltransferase
MSMQAGARHAKASRKSPRHIEQGAVQPRPRLIDRVAAAVAHLFYRMDVVSSPPPEGPLLLLPNHFNALLDPALVMATAGRRVRFLAKSTLFDGPFKPFLIAADAIPVYRKQDGVETARNDAMFAAVRTALSQGEAVCIFPEGISHSSGRLEELRTGAARIALTAAAAGIDVRLVPVGINLERKTSFRSTAFVAYGPPFPVPRAAAADAPPAALVHELTDTIAAHIRAVLVEADPESGAQLIDRVNRLLLAERTSADDPAAELARRRTIAQAVQRVRSERPELYESALLRLRRYDDRLRRFALTDAALDWDVSHGAAMRFAARELPLALVLVPVAVCALITFVLPYGLTAIASKVTSHTDVTATAKVFAGAGIYSGWTLLLAAAVWWFAGAPWGALTALVLPLLAVAGLLAIERETSAWRTARSWLASRRTRRTTRAALRKRRGDLADLMDLIHEWTRGADMRT